MRQSSPFLSGFLAFSLVFIFMTGSGIGTLKLANSQEIGFLEDFVLAKDREKVLKQLVPGTQTYYYYHALHYQNNQQLDKVDELLKPWVKRFGETSRVLQIRYRQSLLKYSDNPEETLAYLTRQLGLNFGHSREIPDAQRELPSKLDESLVSTEKLLARALRENRNTQAISDNGLILLANKKLNKYQRRHLLQRLRRPDFPKLVDLIVTEFKERDAQGFGTLPIHKMLTIKQLDELANKYPKAKSINDYVYTYLSKLHPSEDVDWRADSVEHRRYLERLWSFVETLNPNFNSLKACVLFRQLELDQEEGKYNRELFLTYMSLPRNVGYINPVIIKNVESRSHIVNLAANYANRILLLPVNNDEPLIRDFLHQFLLNASDYKDFEQYVREPYLKQQFAIVKILNGIGDVEKWASMLTPEEYKNVLDRIDIEFLSTNPEFFDVSDEVELELYVKNVDNLIVKVFEINTTNYYRKHKREVDTDITLDGLVPNFEETFKYDTPPALRSKRQFKFPQIKNRGVYVVDFIAGGKSSRALIRKGRLQMSGQVTAVGQLFTVVDQSGAAVTDADLWIGGSRYMPMKDGKILVPFSTQPGRSGAIISQGDFSCLQVFDHMAEKYSFKAALVLDRENLTRSNEARVLIRPSLQIVGGNPVPVSMLENGKLVVTSVNLDGISSTKVVEGIKFSEKEETICEFVVPPRLKTVSFSLTAEFKNRSKNKIEIATAKQAFAINQIDNTDIIQDVHLIPSNRGYFLEVLGKTGEVRAEQAVRVTLNPDRFQFNVNVDLQSDAKGLIELGHLENVSAISVVAAGGSTKNFAINTQDQTYYRTVHVQKGDSIELVAPAGVADKDRKNISVFEVRHGTFVRDVYDEVEVENGLIKISSLEAGDYDMRLAYESQTNGVVYRTVKIRVTEGPQTDNVLVGKYRHLESRGNQALHVSRISTNDSKIRIQLENVDEFTRVHVIANRYQPAFNAFNLFAQVSDLEPWMRRQSLRRSVYMEGRKIGDEYEYILRRKYAQKYPGNMLERPSLLLNPWEVQETSNNSQDAAKGDQYIAAGNEKDKASNRGGAQKAKTAGYLDVANLDYLGESAVLICNLKPSKNGIVTIDRKKLGPNQHVRLIALNAFQTIQRTVNFPLMKLAPRDSRLANALDPEKHYSQSKQIEILNKGESLTINDVVSAKFQQYDELGDVFRLFLTLNSKTHLGKFKFILNWTDKSEKEKRSLYSKYACHELSFFLMKKDREFFTKVIAPHLKNKRDKTFMDFWMLGENVEGFANPWKFARLNSFEKILLSQRLEERSADIKRNTQEAYLVTPTTRSQFDRLYDTTIFGLGMDRGGGRQFAGRPESKTKNLPQLSGAAGGGLGGGYAAGRGLGGGGGPGGGERPQGLAAIAADSVGERAAGPPSPAKWFRENSVHSSEDMFGEAMLDEEMSSEKGLEISNGKLAKKEGKRRGLSKEQINLEMRQVESQDLNLGSTASDKDGQLNYFDQRVFNALAGEAQSLYRRLAPTKEWIENNYYQLRPENQTPALVQINRFWRDYSQHQGGIFLSPYFSESHRTFTEMMFALAVLDLPMKSPEQQFDYVDSTMKMTAGGPTIALHQQVRDAIFDRGNTTILISENFFQKNDRYRHEDGVQYDKFIFDDFLAHTLYGSQVVITNPTSTPRAVELLVQIPLGSVSCSGSQETRTIQMELAAFSTKTFEYAFYFPTAGGFEHYPAHVSSDEKVLAVADSVTFNVADRPAEVDKNSWEFVSQNGTSEEVLEYLNQNNILRLNLDKIAFRMKDKVFYEQAIETLRNRYVYNHTLWAYSVKHNDFESLREYLKQAPKLVSQLGRYFKSDLLTIDPVERNWYQHKEYWPLVNDRAHQLGPQRKILNPNFSSQYNNLLSVLANRRDLTSDDHLLVTYYMLLQDRIETALEHFDRVSKDELNSVLQYDYCDAYLDLYREKPNSAHAKAAMWADYPVDHWRNRFKHILAQVDQIKGGDTKAVDEKDNSQRQTALASQAESFDFEISAGLAKLKYQNVKQVKVNYYEMDIELLFSRSPFAQDELDGFSMIRPNVTQSVLLQTDERGKGSHEFELSPEMRNKNVLVEVVAGDQAKSQPYFAHSLDVQVQEKFGQVHVTDDETGRAIPKTYVKVYARLRDGSIRFHKDGYTDLRGRFDYVSQSNRSIDGIQRFSILILSGEKGAVIRQADRPQE